MELLFGLWSMAGWGVADFLAARASRSVGNLLTLFWMQIFGFIPAVGYFFFAFSSFDFSKIVSFFPHIAAFAVLQIAGYLTFYRGFTRGQVSVVSPLAASWSVVTVVLSVVFFHEVIDALHLVAAAVVMIGVLFVSSDIKGIFQAGKLAALGGASEGFFAMVAWGTAMFFIVPASQAIGWFLPIFLYRFFAIIFLWAYIFVIPLKFNISFRPPLFMLLIPIGILDIGAFFSYSLGVRTANASLVAPVAASFPLITVLLARIFLKERILLPQAAGIAAVIAGLVLISLQ